MPATAANSVMITCWARYSYRQLVAHIHTERLRPWTSALCCGATKDDAALERALTRKLYRKDCPPPESLGEMRLGLLAEGQASAVRAHLDACPYCQAEFRGLDRLLRLEDRERSGL